MSLFIFSCKKTEVAPEEQLVGEYQGTFGPLGYPSTSESCKVIITKSSDDYIDIGMTYSYTNSGKRTAKTVALQHIKVLSSTSFDGESKSISDIDYYTASFNPFVKGSAGGNNISFTVGFVRSFAGKKI